MGLGWRSTSAHHNQHNFMENTMFHSRTGTCPTSTNTDQIRGLCTTIGETRQTGTPNTYTHTHTQYIHTHTQRVVLKAATSLGQHRPSDRLLLPHLVSNRTLRDIPPEIFNEIMGSESGTGPCQNTARHIEGCPSWRGSHTRASLILPKFPKHL